MGLLRHHCWIAEEFGRCWIALGLLLGELDAHPTTRSHWSLHLRRCTGILHAVPYRRTVTAMVPGKDRSGGQLPIPQTMLMRVDLRTCMHRWSSGGTEALPVAGQGRTPTTRAATIAPTRGRQAMCLPRADSMVSRIQSLLNDNGGLTCISRKRSREH